ncbi:hypothetical protein Shyd_69290 [Streptomyces hydrogenans]|uniref:Arc-like DNA binding domain-containing protein n=1 Tax=Streptomyces hydrogenans TaxID=1873719 RepID=A0ABQ3PKL8_9ACTN|nr:hypothetical protein Shyd_69290 [Streptomyces hydrogenans]
MSDANVRIPEEARDRLAAVAAAEGLSLRAYLARLAETVLTPAERAARADKAKTALNAWTGYNPTAGEEAAWTTNSTAASPRCSARDRAHAHRPRRDRDGRRRHRQRPRPPASSTAPTPKPAGTSTPPPARSSKPTGPAPAPPSTWRPARHHRDRTSTCRPSSPSPSRPPGPGPHPAHRPAHPGPADGAIIATTTPERWKGEPVRVLDLTP